MLRRTFRFLGGGHDHGIPTTKEAAHLVQEWILSRPIPPPPGKGMRYANFTYPEHRSKFQLNTPQRHETRAVQLLGEREGHEVSSRTRLSDRSIAAVVSGWKSSLQPSVVSPHSTTRSGEELLYGSAENSKKVRHNVSSIKDLMKYDINECNDYLHRRGCDLAHRLKDYNPKGYEREYFPWQPKPPAPAPPKK